MALHILLGGLLAVAVMLNIGMGWALWTMEKKQKVDGLAGWRASGKPRPREYWRDRGEGGTG